MIIKTLVIFYIALVALFYVISNSMLFHPPHSIATLNDPSANTIILNSASGSKLAGLYLPRKDTKYTMLFSHGNAEDLYSTRPLLDAFHTLGYSVFSYDYEGYGASEGSPNETNTYQAINAAYDYLVNTLKIPPNEIVLYGRSLGAAPTIDLAVRVPVGGVILESPFISAYRTVTQIPLLPFDKFQNIRKVSRIKAPVLVLQGTQDDVVPFWQGKKIYSEIRSRKHAFWVEGAHHNDIVQVAKKTYWNTIKQFINTLDTDNTEDE
jgi:abhydrolase domain-containing protein 17